MGNTTSQEAVTQAETLRIKKLTYEADNFSYSLQLDTFGSSIMRRIFVQKRQKHLIRILERFDSREKIDRFLDQVHTANIEILDSFYEHIAKNSLHLGTPQEVQNQIISPFDVQIGICAASAIMKPTWDPISQKYVNIVDLAKGVSQVPQYEVYKEKGLQIIRQQQICFILLAGGKGMRYDLNQYKQCDPLLQLPSKSSLIELFFKKFEALGRLINTPIHVYILVNDEKHKQKIKNIKQQKIPNSLYLYVDYLSQINYGCLDLQGKLVVDDQNQIFLHPNGSGDLWAHFEGKNYEKSGLKKFKYFQIFGVSNMLEHCFDCFLIGKVYAERIPWATMAAYDLSTKDVNPVIFVNNDKTLHVRDPEEVGPGMDFNNLASFPKKCPHLFLNNTVVSAEFILNAMSSPNWHSHRNYHCKQKKIDHRPPLSKYSQIFVFERELADIFSISPVGHAEQKNEGKKQDRDKISKGAVVFMNKCEYYCNFFTKSDRVAGIVALSNMHKGWLKIPVNRNESKRDEDMDEEQLQQICEIDPYISLEGENLQETIQQIKKLKGFLDYPFYVGSDEGEEYRITNNTATIEEDNFRNSNEQAGSNFGLVRRMLA